MTDSAGDGAYGYMNSFKSRGKRIGYIGIGINEIHNQERKRVYKNVLDRADIVTIRDKHSYSIAKELSNNPNILLTEDLVYLSDEIIRPSPESRRPILLIAWRSLAGYYSQEVENKAIESLVELVRKYSNDYEKIIVTSLGNQVDDNPNRVLFAKLASITDRVQFVESMSFGQRIELICTSTTVITGRLHGIFIAEWNNINTIAIGYDTKVKSFLESIDRTDDLVYPNNLNFDELERALLARHEALTMNDWLVKHNESMKNVQLFEDMI